MFEDLECLEVEGKSNPETRMEVSGEQHNSKPCLSEGQGFGYKGYN